MSNSAMNDKDDIERTGERLRDALGAAAEVMVGYRAPARQRARRADRPGRRAGGWLMPLAAAASVVVIALGAVLIAHLASPTATGSGSAKAAAQAGSSTGTQSAGQGARPEFYLTVTYPRNGPNVLVFQVRRTDGGTVTGSKTISGADVGWGGYITAAAGDRAFYFGSYPCTRSSGIPSTTFDRITITSSGQISGFAPAGRPIKGMVTTLAVSPDGSQLAYTALTKACATGPATFPGQSTVSVENLSTGTVRQWQDTDASKWTFASRLSWAQDGRDLVVDESGRGPQRSELTVYRLDTAGSGGSLQAHSTTLLRQNSTCSLCVETALAGPQGSLTVLEAEGTPLQGHIRVVSIAPASGGRQSVLYRGTAVDSGLFADATGRWLLLWATSAPSQKDPQITASGWISDGQLHPLAGVGQVSPQGIAW